jgi:hypothetical protein
MWQTSAPPCIQRLMQMAWTNTPKWRIISERIPQCLISPATECIDRLFYSDWWTWLAIIFLSGSVAWNLRNSVMRVDNTIASRAAVQGMLGVPGSAVFEKLPMCQVCLHCCCRQTQNVKSRSCPILSGTVCTAFRHEQLNRSCNMPALQRLNHV